MRRLAGAVAVALALGATACGDDEQVSAEPVPAVPTPPPPPVVTAPSTQSPPPAETVPPATVAPPRGSEGEEGGGGDEEAIRVPAAFKVSDGAATPDQVPVPPFLPIELRLGSSDGREHDVTLSGTPKPVTVHVGASGTTTRRVDGLKPGKYRLVVDGEESGATLFVLGGPTGP